MTSRDQNLTSRIVTATDVNQREIQFSKRAMSVDRHRILIPGLDYPPYVKKVTEHQNKIKYKLMRTTAATTFLGADSLNHLVV